MIAWISSTRLTSLVVVLVAIVAWAIYSQFSDRHAPPGPPRLPLLGNVLQMPRQMQFMRFSEWSQIYGMCSYHSMPFTTTNDLERAGHIFSLKILGQNVVVLNSHKAAIDLLGTSLGVPLHCQ